MSSPPCTRYCQSRWQTSGGSVLQARSSGSGWSSPGRAASVNAAGAAGRRHLLQAVGPVAAAAEEAQDDQARPRHDPLDVQVDRHRMTQLEQVRQTQGGRVRRPPGLRRSQAGELGVGRRQDDDVARRLGEVDRLAGILGGRGLRLEQMQGGGPSSVAERGGDRLSIQAALADHDQPTLRTPRPSARRGRNSAGCGRPRPAAPDASACRGRRESP